MSTPREWFALVAEYAPKLRTAGVRRLEVMGCVVDLAPADQPADEVVERQPVRESDPLDDPATFGGRMPRMPRQDDDER